MTLPSCLFVTRDSYNTVEFWITAPKEHAFEWVNGYEGGKRASLDLEGYVPVPPLNRQAMWELKLGKGAYRVIKKVKHAGKHKKGCCCGCDPSNYKHVPCEGCGKPIRIPVDPKSRWSKEPWHPGCR